MGSVVPHAQHQQQLSVMTYSEDTSIIKIPMLDGNFINISIQFIENS